MKTTIAEIRKLHEEMTGKKLPARITKADAEKALKEAQKAAEPKKEKEYVSEAAAKQAAASKASFALPRQVINLKSGEVFNNARQIWVDGELTKAQKNRLRKELYTAAKQGAFPVVEIDGVGYQLFAGYEAAQG